MTELNDDFFKVYAINCTSNISNPLINKHIDVTSKKLFLLHNINHYEQLKENSLKSIKENIEKIKEFSNGIIPVDISDIYDNNNVCCFMMANHMIDVYNEKIERFNNKLNELYQLEKEYAQKIWDQINNKENIK